MAAERLTTLTEQWIRERLQLKLPCLRDVRSLSLPGTYEEKIGHLGFGLTCFVRLKSLDLSYNALVSVEGVQHLRLLERLILYQNRIPSLEEVKVIFELPVLKELDLRLNPLSKHCPQYRPYVVHSMPSLRKMDGCSVRDTERKAAILQFSFDLPSQEKSFSPNRAENRRSCVIGGISNNRLASVDRLTKRLSLPTDCEDIVLKFVEQNHDSQTGTMSDSALRKSKDFKQQRSSTPKQEFTKSILRHTPTKNDNNEFKGVETNKSPHKVSLTSSKGSERPKVSFDLHLDKHMPAPAKQKQTEHPKQIKYAKGYFTPNPDQSQQRTSSYINIRPPSPLRHGLNLSDPSNPILHPARLSYSNFNKLEGSASLQLQAEKKKKGSYRKPLEMLLNLVDKHWRGERSLHQNNNFLSQAVQILSMMESDISSREAEIRNLKQDVDALNFEAIAREEDHKAEIKTLSSQLGEAHRTAGKLNDQLRMVLEENVALQKQLIKLERQYLRSMMKSSPVTQIREAQTEVEELKKEIEGLKKRVQEAERDQEFSEILQNNRRSLAATNEYLFPDLNEIGEH